MNELQTAVDMKTGELTTGPLNIAQTKAHIAAVREVVKSVLVNGTDYGTVPGCGDKPALFKPGAEKLCTTFRFAPRMKVEDLGNKEERRCRVYVEIYHQQSGVFLGSGLGEASSDEDKYAWRKASSEAEFDVTAEDHRRIKWKTGRNGDYQVKQVRTNPADMANTILKMGKKRALVDAVLTVTAASDIFAQDIEDMADFLNPGHVQEETEKPNPTPTQKGPVPETAPAGPVAGDRIISEAQGRRFWALAKKGGKSNEQMRSYLVEMFGVDSTKLIPASGYDAAVKWAESPTIETNPAAVETVDSMDSFLQGND